MNGYGPYYMPQMQSPYMQDQQALQQRIDQLSQMQNQYKQPMQTQQPNVNWIQVNGVDGARNQIVQPGGTSWMMDNNAPMVMDSDFADERKEIQKQIRKLADM